MGPLTMYSGFSLVSESTCLSPNDPKVIKVSSTALGAKRLLEGENHRGHTVPVPRGSKDAVSKPMYQQDTQKVLTLTKHL